MCRQRHRVHLFVFSLCAGCASFVISISLVSLSPPFNYLFDADILSHCLCFAVVFAGYLGVCLPPDVFRSCDCTISLHSCSCPCPNLGQCILLLPASKCPPSITRQSANHLQGFYGSFTCVAGNSLSLLTALAAQH